MITFLGCLAALFLGYAIYGRFLDKIFGPDDRPTPAKTMADGVDYIELPTWRVFLIQLLNIAGTGPIFGALMGAVFGPVVFIWIVCGSVFAGAVHDYSAGMVSIRMKGAGLSEIIGKYLGKTAQLTMNIFLIGMLVMVVAVFVTAPATLLTTLTSVNMNVWIVLILAYYVLATLLPIDKVIAKCYPIFGAALILMVVGIAGGLVLGDYNIPNLTVENLNPTGQSMWPYMFVTVACGAISGFHATQSPVMARCLSSERLGRHVFCGAMIAEGAIALVWAAAGVAFYESTGGLYEALSTLGQSGVVYEISTSMLGIFGGFLAIVGVVACPITTGDTAARVARMTVADLAHMDQKSLVKRLMITIPLLAVCAILTQIDFTILWRYVGWFNQTLAAITLWAISVHIARVFGKKQCFVTVIPATFMTAVSATYILMSTEGFQLPSSIGYPVGLVIAAALLAWFSYKELISK